MLEVSVHRRNRIQVPPLYDSVGICDLPKLKMNEISSTVVKEPNTTRIIFHPSKFLPPLNNKNKINITSNNKDNNNQFIVLEKKVQSRLKRILDLDVLLEDRRAEIIHTLLTMISGVKSNLNLTTIDSFNRVLISIFSVQPPFSVPSITFKTMHFPRRVHSMDISFGYILLNTLYLNIPNYVVPRQIIKHLVRRTSSASIEDRRSAKEFLIQLKDTYVFDVLHWISAALVLPQIHGMMDILEICHHMVERCKDIPGKPPLDEVFESLKLLHFAPHYQFFSVLLTKTIISLFAHSPKYAHDIRLFILNHWLRTDPPRSVLFMKEVTDLCVTGPKVTEYVWQRLSWRSSSIYMPLALEGMNFVLKTIDVASDYDSSILQFLMNDTAKGHWSALVREKAREALEHLCPCQPKPPRKMQINTWIMIKEAAQRNYPSDHFSTKKRKIDDS